MKVSPYEISAGKTAPLIAFAAMSLLSGCATLLGGNVKGSFACSAPGGTCAPTQVIDDQALGATVGDTPGPTASTQPAQGNGFVRTAIGAVAPLRTNERVLRIVFPPRIDAAGRYRESYAVHAVVGQSAWADRGEPSDKGAALFPQVDIGLAALAASAPSLALQEDVALAHPVEPLLSARTPALIPRSSSGSALGISPVEDAKLKVEALLTGERQTALIPPIKSLLLPASSSQASSQSGQTKPLLQVSSPTLNKTSVTPPKAAASLPAPSTQSSAKSPVATRKSSNFPGLIDIGGNQ